MERERARGTDRLTETEKSDTNRDREAENRQSEALTDRKGREDDVKGVVRVQRLDQDKLATLT